MTYPTNTDYQMWMAARNNGYTGSFDEYLNANSSQYPATNDQLWQASQAVNPTPGVANPYAGGYNYDALLGGSSSGPAVGTIQWVNGNEQVYTDYQPGAGGTVGNATSGAPYWTSTGKYDPLHDASKVPASGTPGYRYEWNGQDTWILQPANSQTGAIGGGGANYPLPQGQQQTFIDPQGTTWFWNPNSGHYESMNPNAPTPQQAPMIDPNNTAMINYYQGRDAADLAAQKEQRLATLKANPGSWMEYAALSGQAPVVQPWMLPLMSQQYSGAVAGSKIPGWENGAPSMAQLPALTTPSVQYQARMGPTAQAQWAGYEQARTGATPDETMWRQQMMAPPGGNSSTLQFGR